MKNQNYKLYTEPSFFQQYIKRDTVIFDTSDEMSQSISWSKVFLLYRLTYGTVVFSPLIFFTHDSMTESDSSLRKNASIILLHGEPG